MSCATCLTRGALAAACRPPGVAKLVWSWRSWFAAVGAAASKEVECGALRALLTQQLTGLVCCCSHHLIFRSGCMMPAETWQALSMANALLVADGLLTPEEVRGRVGCVW